MYLSLLFWLFLGLPGFVVVRRFAPKELESGMLGVVGLSYLAAMGLLSPVSILCYVFQAPLAVFSGACVLFVVLALVEILRRGWWRDMGRLFVGALGLGLAALVVDMVMGAFTGAMTGGDAVTHLARVRSILDHGFHNFDPFVVGDYFFPVYHTNILHALYAACAQLTGIHHIPIWFVSLVWAKVLVASGTYYMAWCVYERRWVCWVVAAFAIAFHGPVSFMVYPNKLAPFWLGPMMIGFTVQACRGRCTWLSPLKLAVGALVVGQIHGMYGAFYGVLLSPVLFSLTVVRLARGREDRWWMAASTLALAAALPFILISKSGLPEPSPPKVSVVDSATKSVTKTPTNFDRFDHFDNGWLMLKPRYGWGIPRGSRGWWLTAFLLAGIVAALIGPRRKHAAVFLAVIGTGAAIFYIPPLCALALAVFREHWIVSRMAFVLVLGFVGLVPGGVACLIEPWTRYALVRQLLIPLVCVSGMWFSGQKSPYTWKEYSKLFQAPVQVRERYLNMGKKVAAFCQAHIPRGATVLTEGWSGVVLVANHDAYIVAPSIGGNGIPDLARRRKDLKKMLAPGTPWEKRQPLLKKYKVTHFWPAKTSPEWARGHIKEVRTEPGFRLFVLDTEP